LKELIRPDEINRRLAEIKSFEELKDEADKIPSVIEYLKRRNAPLRIVNEAMAA